MPSLHPLKAISKLSGRSKSASPTDAAQETMPDQPTVAIFGASGHLGKYITEAFLAEETRKDFKEVILFSRQPSKATSTNGSADGSSNVSFKQIAQDTSELRQQLVGVDIVVNAIGSAGDTLRTQIVQAMGGTNVKLYFPSEYGVDHTRHDFSHPEWDKKKAHMELCRNVLKNTKICKVYAGLFLEDSIGPWFGFDTKHGNYESYGSSDELVTYTSLGDVGRSVASLALLPISEIPSEVHLCGSIVSMGTVARLMRNKSGGEIRIIQQSLEQMKAKELAAQRADPSGCLRFLMGEGKIKHTPDKYGCDKELVNPDESKWKWKTMDDLVEETGGRPWADATWS